MKHKKYTIYKVGEMIICYDFIIFFIFYFGPYRYIVTIVILSDIIIYLYLLYKTLKQKEVS